MTIAYGQLISRAGNIGDDLQSLAAAQHLPSPASCAGGSGLDHRSSGVAPLALIMNGWFSGNAEAWPPSPCIHHGRWLVVTSALPRTSNPRVVQPRGDLPTAANATMASTPCSTDTGHAREYGWEHGHHEEGQYTHADHQRSARVENARDVDLEVNNIAAVHYRSGMIVEQAREGLSGRRQPRRPGATSGPPRGSHAASPSAKPVGRLSLLVSSARSAQRSWIGPASAVMHIAR